MTIISCQNNKSEEPIVGAVAAMEESVISAVPTISREELTNNCQLETISYINALQSQNYDVIIDYLFTPYLSKAGYSKSDIRDALDIVYETGANPYNIKSFTPQNYFETNQYYIFEVPYEASINLNGNTVRTKNRFFAFSDKNTEGKIWMFLDNSESTKQNLEKHFSEFSNKLDLSSSTILYYETK